MMSRSRILAMATIFFAIGVLAIALATEKWGELVPCALCLVERWPYRAAALLGVVASLIETGRRILLWGVVCCMAVSVAAASVHVGVELGRWPSPLPECAAPRLAGGSIAERLARLPAHPAKPCDDPAYLIPGVPVSMAAMNGLVALAFGVCLAILLSSSWIGGQSERDDTTRGPKFNAAARAHDPRRSRW